MFYIFRLIALYPHLIKLDIVNYGDDAVLDLPAALRNNDALRVIRIDGVSLVGRAPAMAVAERELRFVRTLKKCKVWRGTSTALLECIALWLRLNGESHLKQLELMQTNLALVA